MPVNLSIKNAPDEVVERLRERARRHHRSLQGELMAIIEAAAQDEGHLTAREALARVRAAGIATPSDSVRVIRALREGRDATRRR